MILLDALTFSVGILLLHSCKDIAPFMKSADLAVHTAKKGGSSRIQSTVCDTGPWTDMDRKSPVGGV